MFANFIVRVRGPDPAAASIAAHKFLDETGSASNVSTLLLVCSYDVGVRAVLVGSDDWRKRGREAARLRDELATREDMIMLAKKIRFHDLFLLLKAATSRSERLIYDKIEAEYLASVNSLESEERFIRATNGIVRELLSLTMSEPSEYLDARIELTERFLALSTPHSFPFLAKPAISLYDARLFDLGGEGPEHYVIASVHI